MLSRYVVSQVKNNSFFLFGLAIGLWIALVAIPLDEDSPPCLTVSNQSPFSADEYEPVHEKRADTGDAAASGTRSVQRPRYYSTELGMRAKLMTAVMTSESALAGPAAALNHTAAALMPALRLFMTAGAGASGTGAPNVVGFTDTREMLKPFHTLKYLTDTYLEEYDFFFLVSDVAFVNAPRLKELVSKLSVSQDVYMGVPADDDSHYCSLDSGILLSNSVLKAIYGGLDWCVRNSYSPHHHENLGRCVLHSAHVSCTTELQGETYTSVSLHNGTLELTPGLSQAVTTGPVALTEQFYQLHAYVSRLHLERYHTRSAELYRGVLESSRRHPRGFHNATWPPGVRADPGLQPPIENRFDHTRWSLLNCSHALFADDHRAAAPHSAAHREALHLVLSAAKAWLLSSWPTHEDPPLPTDITMVEGARRWMPAYGLYYKLLLRVRGTLRHIEVVRTLGAARLVTVPYVTESARVTLLLTLTTPQRAAVWLARYQALCLKRDKNTDLVVVFVHPPSPKTDVFEPIRATISALLLEHRSSNIRTVDITEPISVQQSAARPISARYREEMSRRAALQAVMPMLSKDTLLLTVTDDVEFNEDFLNRVRMNTIPGAQWYSPVAFSRHAQYSHPRFSSATNTGRFHAPDTRLLAVYVRDLLSALTAQQTTLEATSVPDLLTRTKLRCIRAPEPAAIVAPPGPPCPFTEAPSPSEGAPSDSIGAPLPSVGASMCLHQLQVEGLTSLNLGAKHSLAKLLLESADKNEKGM